MIWHVVLCVWWLKGGHCQAADFHWASRSPLPSARHWFGAVGIGSKIYAVGGTWDGYVDGQSEYGYLADLEIYDQALDRWTSGRPMSRSIAGAGVLEWSEKLLVIGGRSGATTLVSTQMYDPSTDRWTEKATMHRPRSGHVAVRLGSLVYVAGGVSGTLGAADVEVYDPAADAWAATADIPTPRYNAGSAAVGGRWYVVGGENGPILSTVESFDPLSSTWSTCASLPMPRTQVSVAALGGMVYAFGGNAGTSTSQLDGRVDRYDPVTNTWTRMGDMPVPRTMCATAVSGQTIFLLGGYSASYDSYAPSLADVEAASLDTEPMPAAGSFEIRNNVIRMRLQSVATLVARNDSPGAHVGLTIWGMNGAPLGRLPDIILDGRGIGDCIFDGRLDGKPLPTGAYLIVASGAIRAQRPVMILSMVSH